MNKNNNVSDFDLMTQKETAEMIRMSEAWLERQRWEQKGIPYIKIGSRIFYDRKDLMSWLKQRKKSIKGQCYE